MGNCVTARLLCGFQALNESVAAPQLNRMLADKALCRFNSFSVVGANEWFESYEMSIVPDNVSSVLCHPNSPLSDGDGMPFI